MEDRLQPRETGKIGFFSTNREKAGSLILFCATFLFVLLQLTKHGSMVDASGDAADIWKTITTYYSEDRYPSYVLYKGVASVYPYVWMYQLAIILQTNEFFFVMCYHAVLFSYVAVIGIPVFVQELTGYKPKLWQKTILVVVLYWYWNRYRSLSQLMVDLPSCAYFFLSVHCSARIARSSGWKCYALITLAGLLCGLCANISGQYSIAALCILVFAAVQIWKVFPSSERKRARLLRFLPRFALLAAGMLAVGSLNTLFDSMVLKPFAEEGGYIASGDVWMRRALIYMIDIPRLFYGPQLYDARGHEIVMSIYGTELGEQILAQAAAGSFGWTIKEYFQAFLQYPVDFVMLYLNRVVISISDDCGTGALRSLLPSYTMVYLTFMTAVKHIKKVKDIFTDKFWIVLGALASMIPVLVMTVEMRYVLSFQAMLYGIAVAGPMLPQIWKSAREGIVQCWQQKSIRSLLDRGFPWKLIGWVAFCLICLAYFGSICAGSGIGESMLFRW